MGRIFIKDNLTCEIYERYEICYWDDEKLHQGPEIRYLKNNRLHRENGPAVIFGDGKCKYWKDGKQYYPNKEE